MIHDKINETAVVICGKNLTECFIKLSLPIFIRDHFLLETITDVKANNDFIIISEDTHEDYFGRLLSDLRHCVTTSTIHNAQLIYQSCIDRLLAYLKKSVEAKQILRILDNRSHHGYTTPLMDLASGGFYDLVQFLTVTIQCNVNRAAVEGKSPLFKASERGHSEVVTFLLKNNADVSKHDSYRRSPLYVICERGHRETAELLLLNNSDISQFNNNQYSPLYVACKRGHFDTVKLLLKYNADVFQCNSYRKSPLFVAFNERHTDIVKLLLRIQYKADVFLYDSNKRSLFVACEVGQTDTVNPLLLNNADISQCNRYGESPLYVACEAGHVETVELLLQNNANVKMCNKQGQTPIDISCKSPCTKIVNLLLKASQ